MSITVDEYLKKNKQIKDEIIYWRNRSLCVPGSRIENKLYIDKLKEQQKELIEEFING